MKSLYEDVPAPLAFDAAIDAARDTLRLGIAYHTVYERLAHADPAEVKAFFDDLARRKVEVFKPYLAAS